MWTLWIAEQRTWDQEVGRLHMLVKKGAGGGRRARNREMFEERRSTEQQKTVAGRTVPQHMEAVSAEFAEERTRGPHTEGVAGVLAQWMNHTQLGGLRRVDTRNVGKLQEVHLSG